MKLPHHQPPLRCVRMARKQHRRHPKQSLVKRRTYPASTPVLLRSTWNLRCSTPSPAKGEACVLVHDLNLSLQCNFCCICQTVSDWRKELVFYAFMFFCSCGEVVSKREQFNDLSIDLPRRKKTLPLRSIQDSLDLFFRVSLNMSQLLLVSPI